MTQGLWPPSGLEVQIASDDSGSGVPQLTQGRCSPGDTGPGAPSGDRGSEFPSGDSGCGPLKVTRVPGPLCGAAAQRAGLREAPACHDALGVSAR